MSDAAVVDQQLEAEKVWDDEVKGRARLFVLYYCTDDECFLNGTRAYQKAYTRKNKESVVDDVPSEAVAAVNASRMLRNAKVRQAIRLLNRLFRDESDEEAGYRILRTWETLAFYDPAEIINARGELIVSDLKELGPLSRCIEGIERRSTQWGTDTIVKLASRRGFMQDLARYLNIIRPENASIITIPVFLGQTKTDSDEWSKAHEDRESNAEDSGK